MEQFPPKFSKVLVTPDPQYIPGYAGYCPQLKYHVGQTYGQLTAKLLSSPEVSHSQRLVLHTGCLPSIEKDTETHDEIWRSWNGSSSNLETMIPGYTGFVPLRQNYFCKTYAETCRDALSEFKQEQKKRLRIASADLSFAVSNSFPDFKPRRPNSPLIAISKDPAPYKAPDPWKPQVSPYLIEDSSPHKFYWLCPQSPVPLWYWISHHHPQGTDPVWQGNEGRSDLPQPARGIVHQLAADTHNLPL
ncbi:protein FAM166B-like isoform X2 [Megalobrama amblycephala]|uniref:protein FAM166B-like isoform X2 n=1 Tax=Megalobrama amblycephala TaxID=75352 RepID=UPI002013E620|nr:protein FAM166B-like isoform X2 [Megalobrama amblycephala]